ncbi:MAG: zinc ribbon domain-containing protein [Clostridium sp.]|uniref:zinc-ribbon domain-containing protein n=1 Tax=Clostridium sp. TaxID=1506 RepID=UPI0025C5DAF0|nr:zinc-ribbon domain-containing protein [Clostridium sp.]MCE5221479.1 zinc ribbon domain-containing protein [Clostridium sp.]
MFFIGVLGIENKDKEIKILNNISCKKCNKTVSGKLIKNFDFFHFFFIPIFKWNEKYYVVCDQCKSVYIIPKDKGKTIEHGENVEISYWDLQEMHTDNYNNNYYEENICANCRKKIDRKFKYCPHCGAKI